MQTAGGGKEGEIKLVALAAADVEALRAAVGATRPEAVAQDEPEVVRRLGAGALLVAALTSGQVGVLVPVLAAVPQLVNETRAATSRTRAAPACGSSPTRPRSGCSRRPSCSASPGCWPSSARSPPSRASASRGTTTGCDPPRPRRPPRVDGRRPAGPGGARGRGRAAPPVRARRAARGGRGLQGRGRGRADAVPAPAPPRRARVPRRGAAGARGRARRARAAAAARVAALRAPARARRARARRARLGGDPGRRPWTLRSRCRAPRRACSPAGPPGGGWRATGSRCARGGSRAITVLAPATRLQEVARSQSLLQRRGRLADVAVAVGAGTRVRVRHLDAGVAAGLYDALRRRRPSATRRVRAHDDRLGDRHDLVGRAGPRASACARSASALAAS